MFDIDTLVECSEGWTLEEALSLFPALYVTAQRVGLYPALTGGTLYKEGRRKDLDILFYRNRQQMVLQREELLERLSDMGFEIGRRYGWVTKAKYRGKSVDLFFPEDPTNDGEYPL